MFESPNRKEPSPNSEAADSRPGILLRYTVAFLCMLVAFEIRYFLTPWLGEELPFMLFVGAALVAAWYGGAVAGMASLLMGLFLSDYFFLSRAAPGFPPRIEALHVVRYVFTASLGIILIEVLHRNRRKLEEQIARREESEARLREAHEQLSHHAEQLDRCVEERTERLSETVEALRDLLYHMAHNLRSPLRAVQGFTSLLSQEYASKLDATARQYSNQICAAASRMDELIHDLLEYGRLGYVQLAVRPVSLEEILESVLFRAAHQIQSAKANVKVLHPLPEVMADAAILEQVLANLLENAIKFVGRGQRASVQIRAEHDHHTVRVWVEDNGIGIDPLYSERIFGAFETLHPRQGYEGTGIGLAIVKQGILRMGGLVGVESKPGAGSRFWIDLPSPCRGPLPRGIRADENPPGIQLNRAFPA
jgi:signal transduction histidine kinase